MAREIGLRVADKKDSQEICFVPDGDHAAFIRRRRRPVRNRPAQIVTTDGAVVGEHDGLERFTIGQRKGLGVALGEPRFVVRLEPDTRRVVIGTRDELARSELTAARDQLAGRSAAADRSAARSRSATTAAACRPLSSRSPGDRLQLPASTSRSTASPPARRSSATTATRCSAAAGSRARD